MIGYINIHEKRKYMRFMWLSLCRRILAETVQQIRPTDMGDTRVSAQCQKSTY